MINFPNTFLNYDFGLECVLVFIYCNGQNAFLLSFALVQFPVLTNTAMLYLR